MFQLLKLARYGPLLLGCGTALYAVHVGSLHRADARTIEALRGELMTVRQREEALEEGLSKARVDAGRLEGLQADLAGTRAYLKQVEGAQRAQGAALQACRRELRDTLSQSSKERAAWMLMPSRQGGGQ